ncbi:sodium/proline symporter [Corynebacterium sp. SA-MJD20WY100]|uniref:sodium/proline symporter n=1 Tax=Corynebacterium sp. SA-MJD20WY100 TaxID=3142969 RepID=UPI00322222B7
MAIFFLVLYFIAMIVIGLWAMRKSTDNSEDYLLGGRSLGPAVTALRLQSSSMSGYMFAGAGSLGYTSGYYGMWYALGDIGGGVLNLSVLGRRMRKLTKILGSISSIEYLEHRYQSSAVRFIAAILGLGGMFLYLLSQFIAGGAGLASVTGIDFKIALIIAVGVIVSYTFMGGYLAVAYTDFVQAIIMVIGMLWILIATLRSVGGLTSGHEQVGALNPNLLTMFGADGEYKGEWGLILGALLIFSIGYMGWPHVVVSHMAMKKPSISRTAGVYSTIFNFLFIPAPYLVGMLALIIVPNLEKPEDAIFAVAETVLPSYAVGIVMAAVMAAIMSTADALLLQASTIAAHDLVSRFFRKDIGEKDLVKVSRTTVLIMAAAGLLFALWQPPTVLFLATFAATVLGSAFAPSYICAVWWKRANKVGAISSMLVGSVVSVVWKLTPLPDSTGIDPMLAGIVCSTIAMVVGSLATQRSHPVDPAIVTAIDEAAQVSATPRKLASGEQSNLSVQFPEEVN